MKAGLLLAAAILAALALAACDDFNRPLKEDIGFYLDLTPVSSWAELKSAAQGLTGPDLIGLAADITPGSTDTAISITRPLTITAFEGSRTIRRAVAAPFTGSFFTVDGGGDLTLGHPQGGSLILDGGADNGVTAVGPLVMVNSGRLTVNDGVTLRNNSKATGNGSGVSVSGGSFTMSGGTIGRNSGSSGGVFVYNGGNFTMSGGTISGNTAANDGGGVYVAIGSFTMSGGTISGNTSDGRGGGGVFVWSGNFTMNGGTISGNTAGGHGGGVYVQGGGDFTMSGGTISGNTAANDGGGVHVSSTGSTFTMSGGTISGNTSDGRGGGMYVASGDFTMNGGTISGNTAANDGGGGVCVNSTGSTFTMSGGTISGNMALGSGRRGGGVFVYNGGAFSKTGGTIFGDTDSTHTPGSDENTAASGDGHAAYVSSGPKKRNSTAGPGDNLDSTKTAAEGGGWD